MGDKTFDKFNTKQKSKADKGKKTGTKPNKGLD